AVQSVGGWETDDPYGGGIMEDRRVGGKVGEKYPSHWSDRYLYHRRNHAQQVTDRATVRVRNELLRRLVQDSLRQCGNSYRPVFGYRGGYLIVKHLIPQKKR